MSKGGGVAVLFRNTFPCTDISFGNFNLFEYLGFFLNGNPKILFLIIYRPPKFSADFNEDLTELLSLISTDFNCIVLTGDFNIHIDDSINANTTDFCSVLDTFGFSQHVQEPTHAQGQTLDLVISKGINISSVVVTDLALSDHS